MTDAIPALVETVRTFVREELIPLEGRFLSRPFRELLPVLGEKRQQVRRLGLWAPHLPREVGGAGLSLPAFARLSEEMGRTPIGHYVFGCQAPDVGNMELLLRHGTPAAARALPGAARSRRRPQLLRDDRARPRRLQPGLAGDHRPA